MFFGLQHTLKKCLKIFLFCASFNFWHNLLDVSNGFQPVKCPITVLSVKEFPQSDIVMLWLSL